MPKKCNAEMLFTALCAVYVTRRRKHFSTNQARAFSDEYLHTAEPFVSMDRDSVVESLEALFRSKRIYLSIDGSCELLEQTALFLDKQYHLGSDS